MTKVTKLNVAQIDVIRAMTANELDEAQARLDEAAFEAALPDGDTKLMLKARDAVNILELKLQGLAAVRKQAAEEEEREKEAHAAARRREEAVKILILIDEHVANLQGLAQTLYEFQKQVEQADAVADRLRAHVFAFTNKERDIENAQTVLVALGTFGTANIPYLYKELLANAPRSGEYTMMGKPRARGLLAKIVPEIEDEAVITEANKELDDRALERFKDRNTKAFNSSKEALSKLGTREARELLTDA